MHEFRVTVILNQFFSDYRATSKVFISKEISTVDQLIKYIGARFGIVNTFYLISNNVYLPNEEDIRVLKEDDIIWAVAINDIPQKNNKQDEDINSPVKHKKSKRKRLDVELTCLETSTPNVKDDHQMHNEQFTINCSTSNTAPPLNSDLIFEKPKKKKKKKNCNVIESDVKDNLNNLEENIQETNDKQNVNRNTNPFMHSAVGTSPYSCISHFKGPRKKHIKPIEISTTPKVIQTIFVEDNPPSDSLEQAAMISFVNSISPNLILNKPLEPEVQKMNCSLTESRIINRNAIVLEPSIVQDVQNTQNVKAEDNIEIKEVQSKPKDTSVPPNRLHQAKQLLLQQIKERFSNMNNKHSNSLASPSSDSKSDLDDTNSLREFTQNGFDDENIVIKKRKRKRVRRIKKCHSLTNNMQVTVVTPPPIFIPHQNIASTHLRFDDSANVVNTSKNATEEDNCVMHTTTMHSIETTQLGSSLNPTPSIDSKERFGIEDIMKYPILKGEQLKDGDIIVFKVLIMSQSYTPEISDYIIGHVVSLNTTDNNLVVKILEGIEQLHVPEGKLLIKDQMVHTDDDNTRELHLNQLLELRLLYP